jgi:hypothetical protein
MTADRIEAIAALLDQTEAAHGAYETTELNGVYDQDWPRWYAAYAVEHGVGAHVGHEITAEGLAAFLAASYADYEQADPRPAEPWSTYAAGRIAAEL